MLIRLPTIDVWIETRYVTAVRLAKRKVNVFTLMDNESYYSIPCETEDAAWLFMKNLVAQINEANKRSMTVHLHLPDRKEE